jgi:thioesterase domain-containing protein/acyl carrier protein
MKFQFLFPAFTQEEVDSYSDQLLAILHQLISDSTQNVGKLCSLEHVNQEDEIRIHKYRYVSTNEKLIESMKQIWEEVLAKPSIDIHQNFFELGGHSFDALAIVSRVEQDLGYKLPLAKLFQFPTITELCYQLEHDQPIQSIVLLQQGNEMETPLFLIHGQGGGVLSYYDLVKQLDSEQTIYGIQAKGFEGEADYIASIDEMADYYVSLIQQLQPVGPYRLAGWSMGGVLAHLITTKFEKLGEQVEFLALIDSTWLEQDEGKLLEEQLKSDEFKLSLDKTKDRLWLENGFAFARYRLGKVVYTPIHLFVAEDRSQTIGSTNWTPWTASTVHANIVDGNHLTMLQTTNVEKLARSLQSALDSAAMRLTRKGD